MNNLIDQIVQDALDETIHEFYIREKSIKDMRELIEYAYRLGKRVADKFIVIIDHKENEIDLNAKIDKAVNDTIEEGIQMADELF